MKNQKTRSTVFKTIGLPVATAVPLLREVAGLCHVHDALHTMYARLTPLPEGPAIYAHRPSN